MKDVLSRACGLAVARLLVVLALWSLALSPGVASAQRLSSPIVAVHGLCSGGATWAPLASALQLSRGWTSVVLTSPFNAGAWPAEAATADVYIIDFSDPVIQAGLEQWAVELATYLQQINVLRTAQGGLPPARFTIVAHSAGGLAARAYLQSALFGGDVSHLVTYGTPHLGAPVSRWLALVGAFPQDLPPQCRDFSRIATSVGIAQMAIDNPFLNTLNALPFPSAPFYTSLTGVFPPCRDVFQADNDCVVSAASQDLRNVPTAPAGSEGRATSRLHVAQTTDVENVTWAVDRVLGLLPGRPLGPRATTMASDVLVSWIPPASGGPVSTYILEGGTARGSADVGRVDTGSFKTSFSFSGVPAGRYFVRVIAANAAGEGLASEDVEVVIATP
jgi:pimeloyl-ACP methyl ester carboxylesterase